MTISKITIGDRKHPKTGYQAIQLTSKGRLVVSICPSRLEAINEVLKETAKYNNHE